MKYSLHNFTMEEMKEFLNLFSDAVLCKPILKNPKHFTKDTKGFRANKVARHILNKIYYEEIHNTEDSSLEKFLIEYVKMNFEHTRIEALVDSVKEGELLEVAAEIEKEIIHSGLTISPKQVFMLAGHSIEPSHCAFMDAYHRLVLDDRKLVIDEYESKLVAEHEMKYNKLKNSYEQVVSSLDVERVIVKDLKELGKQKDVKIESREAENILLLEKLKKMACDNEVLKDRTRDYETKSVNINKLTNDISKLTQRIEELQMELSRLKERALSPEMVKELCVEVMDDLRIEDVDEDRFIAEASQFFAVNEQLGDSWKNLSDLEMEKLVYIITKMEEESVCDEDIDTLDFIDNYVHYKYMIIKGLKVIFYRYLEQKLGKQTIDQKFKKS